MKGQYPFDQTHPTEYPRLVAHQETYDPRTIQHLEARGVDEGWQCLEVGAGAGSIALWLCKRVGNTGRVIATDKDTSFLDNLNEPNLHIWKHDILTDDLPKGSFDIVHSRLLLDIIPERGKALDHMIEAAKIGGWIVLEEFDSITSVADPSTGDTGVALFLKIQNALLKVWKDEGHDAEYGRKLLGQLYNRGLTEIGAEGRVFIRQGGSPGSRGWRLTVEQKKSKFVEDGSATVEEIDRHLAQLDDPKFFYLSPTMITAWGRRPLR